MFTGIVRELGCIETLEGDAAGIRLGVLAPAAAAAAAVGDSVALNGVCLTVTRIDGEALFFDAVPETLERTSLSGLVPGDRLNVEPALRAGEPLGGHIVQGHVDAVGRITAAVPEGEGVRLTIEAPADVLRYCVVKGSVAVQGVSLTIARLHSDSFEIALIPHTLAATTLGTVGPGSDVNLEVDVIAKYVERLLPPR